MMWQCNLISFDKYQHKGLVRLIGGFVLHIIDHSGQATMKRYGVFCKYLSPDVNASSIEPKKELATMLISSSGYPWRRKKRKRNKGNSQTREKRGCIYERFSIPNEKGLLAFPPFMPRLSIGIPFPTQPHLAFGTHTKEGTFLLDNVA